MKCPGCGSDKIQPINKDKTHFYCTECNAGFQEGAKKVEHGHLEFAGVDASQRIFEMLTGDRKDMTPEMKAALETQMTGIIFEQWFEGFKAGQLANIAYVKGYYNDNGKTRSKSTSTTGQHEDGTSRSGEQANHGKDSDGGNSDSRSDVRNQSIRERIGKVNFEYPNHIKVPENIYQHAAELVEKLNGEDFMFKYDGRKLDVVIKTGK